MKKMRKKKHSMDLTLDIFRHQKNGESACQRMLKKSNNNSVSSNAVMSMVSTQHKKIVPKQKKLKIDSKAQKKQKQLGKLLQNFRYGSMDKNAITKEIVKIFDSKNPGQDLKKKPIKNYNKNGTISANPSTPKNSQFSRLNSFATNNIKNIHKVRKKQCQSARSSFSKSKSMVVHKKQLIQKIVEIKAIDSSLFLSEREDEHISFTDRVIGIKTSDSVVDLNEYLKQQRKSFTLKPGKNPYKQRMAIKIQRAWRKYKTRNLIYKLLNPPPQKSTNSGLNNILDKLDQSPIVTEKSHSQKYQSQEIMANKASIFEAEKAKGEVLRVQEVSKWNEIMDYVKINMENKQISSEQCLSRIIDYFENAKNTVEKQLKISNGGKVSKEVPKNERELTEFTNQISKQMPSQEIPTSEIKYEKVILSSSESDSSFVEIQEADSDIEIEIETYQKQKQSKKYTFNLQSLGERFLNSKSVTFDTIEQALQSYNKKIQFQKEEEIQELDLHSRDYLRQKQKIERRYSQTRKQLRKIIRNLNRGYDEVKTILNKSLNEEQSKVTRCKSDDYLLRTAINYKEYVESMGVHKQQKNSNTNTDKDQNSFEPIHSNVSGELEEEKVQTSGFKLDDNIMSEELMQYEEVEKRFDDDSDDDKKNQHAEEISLFDNTRLNEKSKKLQYVCTQDKDDIFEFIFIDLALEITMDVQPNGQIMKSLKKYMEKANKLKTIPRGVKTNLLACKQYLAKMHTFIKKNYLYLYFKHIEFPMGPSASQMLKYMHEQDDDSNDDGEEMVPLILPITIFEHHEEIRDYRYERYYDQEEKEVSRVKFLKSVEHIHCKAIFDCLNQWLDAERPFGIWGKPFPWKKNVKTEKLNEPKKLLKLGTALDRTVQSCSYLCGILVDKEDSLFANHKVSDYHIDQIRQDRMSKMLSNQLIQNEQKWVFYDDEETEVLIQITKNITRKLFEEACFQIFKIY